MAMLAKFSVSIALSVIALSVYVRVTTVPITVPDYYFEDHNWSLETSGKENLSIRPFRINIDEKILVGLKDRLRKTRYQESLEGVNFTYGFNSNALKNIVNYWIDKYDWRKQEKYLNSFPQFKTTIEGIQVHFIHVKPQKTSGNKPILLVHSWPGSVIEFYKMIPLLVKDGFEVIIPSLPGYGFSEAPQKPGFDVMHAGRILAKLMSRINHEKFYYHGGDWGSIVGKAISVMYPQRILGYHSTLPNVQFNFRFILKILVAEILSPSLVYNNPSTEKNRLHPIKERIGFVLQETGYFHIQASKPDTSGIGLNDSPAGLGAYILEKFSTWTDPSNCDKSDGGLSEKYSIDDLLTNVMIYWTNNCIISANRFYKEYISVPNFSKFVVSVPVALLLPKHELLMLPPTLLRNAYADVVHIHELNTAGHFSAFEEPEMVADDINSFVTKITQ